MQKADRKLKPWFDKQLKLKHTKLETIDNYTSISSLYSLINDSAIIRVQYIINANGTIKVNYSLSVQQGLPNIPRVGMQMGIENSYENIQWMGRGPMENYIDRRYGFDVGVYEMKIDQFMEPYVVPQENGNRTDVRWMFLHNEAKQGMLVLADSLLSMSAWPFTEENIQAARHTNKLKKSGYITLNIDLIQMGVGGNDSWSDVAAPLDQYQVPARDYNYTFYLTQISNNRNINSTGKTLRF